MTILPRRAALLLLTFMLMISLGCARASSRTAAEVDADKQAKFKADAMRRLADAMAKDPEGPDARAALEDFRNVPFDVQANPNEADEIATVYRQRIEGKYQGDVMDMVRLEMAGIEAWRKKTKR
jgi:hypothetical protein